MNYAPPPPPTQYRYPYPYPWPQPPQQPPARQEEGPAPRAPRGWWSDRYGLIFGVVVTALTLAAILLAVVAPGFSARTTKAPASWSAIYSGNPKDDPNWQQHPTNCAMRGDGLLAEGPGVGQVSDVISSLCVYAPTQGHDLVSQGFALDLTVAPAVDVSSDVRPAVFIGDPGSEEGVLVEIGQGGGLGAVYLLCDSSGDCASQPTVAWHTDGFVANTLSLRYSPATDGGQLILSGNGQQVAAIDFALPPNSAIAIGAGSNASALYTGFTFSTPGGA